MPERTAEEWDCYDKGRIWVMAYTKKNGVKVRGYCKKPTWQLRVEKRLQRGEEW